MKKKDCKCFYHGRFHVPFTNCCKECSCEPVICHIKSHKHWEGLTEHKNTCEICTPYPKGIEIKDCKKCKCIICLTGYGHCNYCIDKPSLASQKQPMEEEK